MKRKYLNFRSVLVAVSAVVAPAAAQSIELSAVKQINQCVQDVSDIQKNIASNPKFKSLVDQLKDQGVPHAARFEVADQLGVSHESSVYDALVGSLKFAGKVVKGTATHAGLDILVIESEHKLVHKVVHMGWHSAATSLASAGIAIGGATFSYVMMAYTNTGEATLDGWLKRQKAESDRLNHANKSDLFSAEVFKLSPEAYCAQYAFDPIEKFRSVNFFSAASKLFETCSGASKCNLVEANIKLDAKRFEEIQAKKMQQSYGADGTSVVPAVSDKNQKVIPSGPSLGPLPVSKGSQLTPAR